MKVVLRESLEVINQANIEGFAIQQVVAFYKFAQPLQTELLPLAVPGFYQAGYRLLACHHSLGDGH